MFSLSLGAAYPAPSTWRGTMVKTAAVAGRNPRRVKPVFSSDIAGTRCSAERAPMSIEGGRHIRSSRTVKPVTAGDICLELFIIPQPVPTYPLHRPPPMRRYRLECVTQHELRRRPGILR